MAESLEMRIYFQPGKRLDPDGDHIRLITIMPLEPDTPPAAPIECQLADYCLNDQHFTPAYRTHLDDTMALGASDDSQRPLHRRGPGHGPAD